jgi:hypothetical protein
MDFSVVPITKWLFERWVSAPTVMKRNFRRNGKVELF